MQPPLNQPLRNSAKTVKGSEYRHPLTILADQRSARDSPKSKKRYPEHLRRIRCKDPGTNKHLVFLTLRTDLDVLTICALYKSRWQVELFFQWIKQHLRVKRFFGTSENAVKLQLWIAVSVYVLVAILRKRLAIDTPLYTIMQILSVMPCEQIPLAEALPLERHASATPSAPGQLHLFPAECGA